MVEVLVNDELLASLNGQVVFVTGCASGIGLATVRLLLSIGAKVFAIDRSEKPSLDSDDFDFVRADVTSWEDQIAAFEHCIQKHGHVDHVFANAGINSRTSLLEDELDANGKLKPPVLDCFDINLKGVVYTLKLGIHYIKKKSQGGSVVLTASASSFQRFGTVDYTAAKHGVLGLVRALYHHIGNDSEVPVRLNCIAPSWTLTGILSEDVARAAGLRYQAPEDAARSALIFMADKSRHGQMMYSLQGKYVELEESMLHYIREMLVTAPCLNRSTTTEVEDFDRLRKVRGLSPLTMTQSHEETTSKIA